MADFGIGETIAAIASYASANAGVISAVAAVAGTAVSVTSSIEQGEQQKAQADYNARVVSNNALEQQDAAQAAADRIRKVGLEEQSTANANLGAAGVKVGEGSASDINRTIGQNTEQDAFNTLLTGQRQAASGQQQSDLLKTSGDNAESNSYIGAGATILGSASKIASGWKTSNMSTSGGT